MSSASASHFVTFVFSEKNQAATLHFSLVSFMLGIYQIPLPSGVKVPVDFSKHWSRPLCYTIPFVLRWQVSLGLCTFLSLTAFEGCLPPSRSLFSPFLPGTGCECPIGTERSQKCTQSIAQWWGHLLPCLSGCVAARGPGHARERISLEKNCWRHQEVFAANRKQQLCNCHEQARRAVSCLRIPVKKITRQS